jgi:signal transduction histidine kinase/DNA-binding NarL/FixJ family response regulator
MHLLRKFNNTSIKAKVVSLTMLLISLVITIALGFMLFIQYREIKQVLVNEMTDLARIIANRTSVAVSFMDQEVAMENLNALSENPNIQQAAIIEITGDVFASYQKEDAVNITQIQRTQAGVYDDFSTINITQEITEGDELLGYFFLQSNLSPIWGALKWSLIHTFFLYIFCLLLSFYLALKIQGFITAPILSLLETSKTISSEQNYQVRAEKSMDDEVGALVDQFNAMLSIIDRNEQTLKSVNTELEQKVVARTRDLARALKESKAANHAKSVFLSHMSHELLTPLNAINGYSQILVRQENLTTTQRKQVDTVYKCGDHLLKLIHDVLDYSQLEAGHLEVEKAPFNLVAMLRRVHDMVRLQTEQKCLDFHFSPSDSLPKTVNGDEKRISQVLLNLLSNAIKYTPAGSIAFRIYLEEADIVFEVQDSGVGIPKEVQDRIFSPFYRVSKTKKMVDGLGLGMAITQQFASAMNGQILLDSQEGVGSTFRFKLPLQEVCLTTHSNIQHKDLAAYRGEQKRLLLVDDNASNLSILISMLEPIGFKIQALHSSQEVIQTVIKFKPDALLIDLKMSDNDGKQVLEELANSSYPGKVIGLSSITIESLNEPSFRSLCDDLLPKPVDADQLTESLEKLLKLEWVLNSEVSLSADQNRRKTKGVHKLPPIDVIQELRNYLEEGNFAALTKSIEINRDRNPDYAEFYNEALVQAENFDDESLLSLLT